MEPIIRLIGEQGRLGALAARRERARARYEHPLVRRSHEGHEEGIEMVVVVDPVPLDAVFYDEAAGGHAASLGLSPRSHDGTSQSISGSV